MKKVYIYKRFERIWHWTQALLILLLIITGFEIHSTYELFGYRSAVAIHNNAGWAFLALIILAVFWHFTTGEWKQYIPTGKMIKAQIEYYVFGIFKNAPHPTKKLIYNKFNPLQRIVYLGLKILVIPVQVITGFLYLFYPDLSIRGLEIVAVLHTLGAFLLISFVIAHIYLVTLGHKATTSIKAMITGWEEMDDDAIEEIIKDEIDIIKTKIKIDEKNFGNENLIEEKISKLINKK